MVSHSSHIILYRQSVKFTIFGINQKISGEWIILINWIRHNHERIEWEEFTRKKCKTAILLYCFHTAGVLHIFMLYNLLGPGISFNGKSKIIVKRKPNYEIGWFHNWPIIISHRLYAFHFTNNDFPI